MFKARLLENILFIVTIAITIILTCTIGKYVESKNSNNTIIQINYLNGGDKVNNGWYTK